MFGKELSSHQYRRPLTRRDSDFHPISVTPLLSRTVVWTVVKKFLLPFLTALSLRDQFAYCPSWLMLYHCLPTGHSWAQGRTLSKGCGKKSNPLSYFANFWATALNFLMKLCSYILRSYRHTTAKYRLSWNLTRLCDFKRDNPTVLTWLKYLLIVKRQEHVTNCTTIFLQQNTTNCSFNVRLSVQSVHHWPVCMPSGVLWTPWRPCYYCYLPAG